MSENEEKNTDKTLDKAPLLCRVLGVIAIIQGIVAAFFMTVIFIGLAVIYFKDPQLLTTYNSSLTILIAAASCFLGVVGGVLGFLLGRALLKNKRKRAGILAAVLVGVVSGNIILSIMYSGVTSSLIVPSVELVVLIVISVTIDPQLIAERRAKIKAEEEEDREAASEGLLGRDLTRKGYLKLDFFNLFWVFVVCCFIGLVLETIWHIIVVDPGVYQNRTGVLYGPFSPIYGFGALLMTIMLNRLYDKNPILIFLASSVIGGAFECAVSLFMSTAFGVIAWDYTGFMLFGNIPDPVAALTGGRTSLVFACIWGLLGLVWIKLLLPLLLKFINRIPWNLRYSLTAVCAVLMVIDGAMTLISLDCWYERVCGEAPETAVEVFFAENYDNDFMQNHFASMEIYPEDATRAGH